MAAAAQLSASQDEAWLEEQITMVVNAITLVYMTQIHNQCFLSEKCYSKESNHN